MALEPFFWGSGGRRLTPEEIDRERQIALALRQQSVDTSPVGHWSQGAARVVNALGGVLADRRANAAAKVNADENQTLMQSLLAQQDQPFAAPVGGQNPSTLAPTSAAAPNIAESPIQAVSMPQGERANYIRDGLIKRGIPDHIADGFVVNFQDESGLDPGINEKNPIVKGSRGGFGLYQLTGPRRRAYESFASERGVNPADIDAQLDFLKYEIDGPEANAFKAISATKNKSEAAQAIVTNFLRPAEEHRLSRVAKYASLTDSAPAGIEQVVGSASNNSRDAFPPAPQRGMGGSTANIAAIIANPYASDATKSVAMAIMQKQERQAQMQAQMALKQQQQQQMIAQRQAIAQQTGINPAFAADDTLWEQAAKQQFADPATATVGNTLINSRTGQPIYTAPKELPASVQEFEYGQQNPEFFAQQERLKRAGATSNNISMGGGKFDEEFAKGDAKTLIDTSTAGLAAQRNLGRINQLESLIAEAPGGFSAALAQRAGEWGINTEGLDALQAAQASINALVPEQRAPGSGPMSDADLELFKQSLPRIINTPEGNKRIIGTLRGIAQYDAEGAKIIQDLRNEKITRAQAFETLQSRKNPLDNFKVEASNQSTAIGSDWVDRGNGVKIRRKQ